MQHAHVENLAGGSVVGAIMNQIVRPIGQAEATDLSVEGPILVTYDEMHIDTAYEVDRAEEMFDAAVRIEEAADLLGRDDRIKELEEQVERLQREVDGLEKEKSSLEKHQTKTISNLEERRKELQEENRKQRQKIESLQQEIYRLQGLALAAVSGELPSLEEKASERLEGPEYLFLNGKLVGNKLVAIKAVRAMTSLGLKDAKSLVDDAVDGTPQAAQVDGENQEDHLRELQDCFDGEVAVV